MLDLGITAFGNDLVAVWRGFGTDQLLYYSSFDGSNWSAPANIPGVSSSIGPSLAVFNGGLYAAWKGFATDSLLYYSSFDGSSWAPQEMIPGVSSSIGPSLAVFNGRLYAAWKGFDTDEQLWYSSFDGSSWAPQAQIPGHSIIGPSLAGFDGRLYAAWRGSGTDQQLWYSSFDGSNWAPQANIPGVSSAIGPTLRVGFSGRLYAAWRGFGTDTQLWYSSFDGSNWAPQGKIPGANSITGPSLTAFNNKLYAAWDTGPSFTSEGSGGPWIEQLEYSSYDGGSWAPRATIPGSYTEVPPSNYVYTVLLNAGGLLGGELSIAFYPYGSNNAGATPLATFSGVFGGLFYGSGAGWGTAQLYYDVVWLAQQGWSARFVAWFIPPSALVNLWGLSGENIGNVSADPLGKLGIVAGQGPFYKAGP